MTEAEKTSYLHRRDELVEILDSLKGYWNLAEGLSAFLGSAYVTPEVIDGIEEILKEAIQETKDTRAKEHIQAGLDRIASIKEQEMTERSKEQSQVTDILLDNFII